jgi:hypothetical protein
VTDRWFRHRTDISYAVGLAAGVAFFVGSGALAEHDREIFTSDFSGIWSGARGLLLGDNPYDAATWRTVAASLGGQLPDTPVYGYPPWVAVALVPLALLPLQAAAGLWLAASVVVAAVALRALLRVSLPGRSLEHGIIGASLFMAQPGYRALVNGQWTFVLVAATATVALLLATRPRLAAAVALLWLAKPQLFVFAALGWGWGRPRFAATAMVLGLAIVGLGTLALPGWWPAWSAGVAPVRLDRPATVPSALADLVGPAGRAVGLGLIGAAAVATARAFGSRGSAALAMWSALSVAGALYIWSYDHLLLVVPLIIAAGAIRDVAPARARWLLIGGAAMLAVISPMLYAIALARGRETYSAILPTVFVIAIGALCWPVRSNVRGAG